MTALLLVAAAGVIGAILLTQGADDDPDEATDRALGRLRSTPRSPATTPRSSASSPTDDLGVGDSLPATAVVLPVTVDGATSLYVSTSPTRAGPS